MSELSSSLRLAFLGTGSMNGAILRGILASGHDPDLITATIRSENRKAELQELGVNVVVTGDDAKANAQVAAAADVVFLGVKPVGITQLCAQIASSLKNSTVVVSVAAAITLESMAAKLPAHQPLIRSMPNTPLQVGAGVVGLTPAEAVSEESLAQVVDLFSGSGDVHVIAEAQQDALAALSGSGPAYVFYLAEAMAKAGVQMGLDESVAIALARATVAGAGKMLADPQVDPAELRRKVTSPNGTTEQAIAAFDRAELPQIVAEGMAQAARRAAELSTELG